MPGGRWTVSRTAGHGSASSVDECIGMRGAVGHGQDGRAVDSPIAAWRPPRARPGSGCPSSRGSGPFTGRLRTPLTIHVVGGGFGLPVSGAELRPGRTAARRGPGTAGRAGPGRRRRGAGRAGGRAAPAPAGAFRSDATARCGLPGEHLRRSPVSTACGPTSTKTRAPAVVHRLDLVREADRRDEVLGELRGDAGRVAVWGGGRVREHRLPRGGELEPRQAPRRAAPSPRR